MGLDPGYLLLILAFFASLYSTYAFLLAVRSRGKKAAITARKGEQATYLYSLIIVVAYLLLTYYFLVRDFDVQYVYYYSDSHLNLAYTISAVWAGREGSLLLWAFFLSILNVVFLRVEKKDALSALALSISSATVSFFVLVMLTFSNPFQRFGVNPGEGYGLNPLLRTPEMALHPPTVFLGYAAATIPFALAIGSIYLKQDGWHLRARLWALVSWIFLSVGIFLGAWWAYKTLGWGGFWAWDPVENASLLPWLTITALLHGIMRNRSFKSWNYWLAYVSFALVIFATFITRSGIIESVHAFGENPEGWLYLILIAIAGMLSAYLFSARKDVFHSEQYSTFSRDFAIFLNMLILILSTATVLIGTVAPTLVSGISVGREYYDRVETPLAILLTVLLGACISIGWRADRENTLRLLRISVPAGAIMFALTQILAGMFYVSLAAGIGVFSLTNHLMTFRPSDLRNARKAGGYIVHIGIILIAIGVAGAWMYDEVHQNVRVGIKDKTKIDTRFGDITLEITDARQIDHHDRSEVVITLNVYENGVLKGTVTPTITQYNLLRQDRVIYSVSILSDPFKDIYIAIGSISMDSAFFEVHVVPLVSLVWLGSILVIAGGVVSAVMNPPRKE
ncbi:heme lyase CcmF/NrfE family subunit [Geoglobus acetivorans]|uniref:Cytochrome c assembly protein n=1 Tax=Geoglobus acetivorans TaxID=565033 RepID=A0A0A7GFF5_GEOAI|nr:cytochrome c assembly protein [Geoglobus acetivorans]